MNELLQLPLSHLVPRIFAGSRIEGPGFRCYNTAEVEMHCDSQGLYVYYDRPSDTYQIYRKGSGIKHG